MSCEESAAPGGAGASRTREHRATLLPGDGIGPEVIEAACAVLEASGARIQWERVDMRSRAAGPCRDALPAEVLASIRRHGVALKGPVTTGTTGRRSVNVALRRELGLYAQVRLCRTLRGVPSRFHGVDLAIVRETTEDLYAGVELGAGSSGAETLIGIPALRSSALPRGVGISIKYVSEPAVRAVARFTLDWARAQGRKRVTVVHKATVMRATDGLFLSVAKEVAASYGDLEVDDALVDDVAARLVRSPERYNILLTSNLYGDILSDLAAGLVGGVGVVPGANFGRGLAVFEAAHGSAPRHAGRDRANPTAVILSGALMLRHLGEHGAAARVERAVGNVLGEGRSVTYDVAGPADAAVGTSAFAAAVIEALGDDASAIREAPAGATSSASSTARSRSRIGTATGVAEADVRTR